MTWQLSGSAIKKRLVTLASKQDHCLNGLLHRWRSGELLVDIPCVNSSHKDLRSFVKWHGTPQNFVAAEYSSAMLRNAANLPRHSRTRSKPVGDRHKESAANRVAQCHPQ